MVRILHIIGSLANGGVESFILNLYRNIDTTKIQFDFIVGTANDWCNDYENEILCRGGKIHKLHGRTISQIIQFRTILKEHPEYNIIHSHRYVTSALFLFVAKNQGRTVRIAHSHNAGEKGLFGRIVKKIFSPMLVSVSTTRLACGQLAGNHLFGNSTFRVFPNGIDLERYKYSSEVRKMKREQLGYSDTDIVIGHVGRLDFQKNHEFLIKVFKLMTFEQPCVKLMIVGGGYLKYDIIKQLNSLDLLDITQILEQRSDVNELLQAMDYVIFPSRFEGFSIAMVEMQASGLHILCSDQIPPEINITGEVIFKSLTASCEEWAKEALSHLKYERSQSSIESLRNYGLDIKKSTIDIQNIYLNSI